MMTKRELEDELKGRKEERGPEINTKKRDKKKEKEEIENIKEPEMKRSRTVEKSNKK